MTNTVVVVIILITVIILFVLLILILIPYPLHKAYLCRLAQEKQHRSDPEGRPRISGGAVSAVHAVGSCLAENVRTIAAGEQPGCMGPNTC